MTRIITLTDVMDSMRRAVEAAGEDKTANCIYVQGGEPVCIIGVVLANLGLKLYLDAYTPIGGSVVYAYRTFEGVNDVKFTSSALAVMVAAQKVQDNGGDWGLAFKVAGVLSVLYKEPGYWDKVREEVHA